MKKTQLAAADQSMRATADLPQRPWWREPMMWLVLGAPAAAVVASLGTVVVAYRYADEIVQDAPRASQVVRPTTNTPALSARNHAATAAPR